jgi:hypothetical protein
MPSSSSDASTNSSFASQSSFEEVATQAVQRRRERQREQQLIVVPPRKGGGSHKGKNQNVDHGRLQHNFILLQDYFDQNLTYSDKKLQLIILSACSTPGRDQSPITLPRQPQAIPLHQWKPAYNEKCFCCHFCMCCCVFDQLLNAVEVHERYFLQKKDA